MEGNVGAGDWGHPRELSAPSSRIAADEANAAQSVQPRRSSRERRKAPTRWGNKQLDSQDDDDEDEDDEDEDEEDELGGDETTESEYKPVTNENDGDNANRKRRLDAPKPPRKKRRTDTPYFAEVTDQCPHCASYLCIGCGMNNSMLCLHNTHLTRCTMNGFECQSPTCTHITPYCSKIGSKTVVSTECKECHGPLKE